MGYRVRIGKIQDGSLNSIRKMSKEEFVESHNGESPSLYNLFEEQFEIPDEALSMAMELDKPVFSFEVCDDDLAYEVDKEFVRKLIHFVLDELVEAHSKRIEAISATEDAQHAKMDALMHLSYQRDMYQIDRDIVDKVLDSDKPVLTFSGQYQFLAMELTRLYKTIKETERFIIYGW